MQKIINEYLDAAGDATNTLVGLGTGLLAARIDQYARMGDEIVRALRNSGETQVADVAETFGSRAHDCAQYLRERDGRRIWSDLQDSLNGRGWVAATAGLAAGALLARIVRSSPGRM